MLDQILAYGDKIDKLFDTFKISIILGVIVNFIIIVILFKLTDIFTGKLKNKFSHNENALPISQIIPILEKIIKTIIIFVIAASFLQSHGYSLTSLIAGFGITGLAVGFAAQQTIASMFGTLGILTDKVYKTGDYIKIDNTEGTVENINLRSTKIRTLDNHLVTIPNDKMANSVVTNVTMANKRRIDLIFGVTYDTSDEKLNRAIEIIKQIASERQDIHKDYTVFIEALDSSSINIRLLGYAKTKSFDVFAQIRSGIYLEAVKRFRTEDIEFAFPSTTIYMAENKNI